MKVLIVGAGRLGTQIAQVLAATGDDVSLIDIDDDRIAELQGHISARLVSGDACEPTVLEDAGALTTDLLVAATGDDEDNLVISLLAKRQFAVPRVAARINDTDNGWLFDHHWGVDVAVPAATPLISLIEEATGATDTVALLRLSKAGVNVIETAITPHSRAVGHALADITLPSRHRRRRRHPQRRTHRPRPPVPAATRRRTPRRLRGRHRDKTSTPPSSE